MIRPGNSRNAFLVPEFAVIIDWLAWPVVAELEALLGIAHSTKPVGGPERALCPTTDFGGVSDILLLRLERSTERAAYEPKASC
jgi:hypothetical protein